jgi:tetratricopeptide (TPR) repeat protein
MNPARLLLLSLTAAVVSAVAVPSARWASVAKPIPTQRLIRNLESRLRDDRRNADLLTNLARLHAYTFATKHETVPQTPDGLFESSPHSDLPAYEMVDPVNPRQRAQAARHLERAIGRYRQALNVDGEHLIARLGLAWCLEQAGQKSEAIAEYRTLFDQAWPREQGHSFTTVFKPFVTEEAGRRLLALLGASAAAEEIQHIKGRMHDVGGETRRAITPIAVPLDRAWSPQTESGHRAVFDADGSGLPRSWSWISPAAAWLVYDDRHGKIESALQLFGNVTFWMFWENGYDALWALDDNGDQMLRGSELKHLALWRDLDVDGVSDPGEVASLAHHGITALSCRHVVVQDENSPVAAYATEGVTFRDGSARPTFDLILTSGGELRRP